MMNKTVFFFLLLGGLCFSLSAELNSTTGPFSDFPGTNETEEARVDSPRVPKLVEVPGPDSGRRSNSAAENESSKPQKSRKKILASNLKNSTEKFVPSTAKLPTQAPKVEDTIDDGGVPVTAVTVVALSTTEGKVIRSKDRKDDGKAGDSYQNDTIELARDEDPDETEAHQEREGRPKTGLNLKFANRNIKVTTSTTESYASKYTTTSYMFYTLGEVQKSVNNYLNANEDSESSSSSSSSSNSISSSTSGGSSSGNSSSTATGAALLQVKPTSISNPNSVKNLVRLRNGYYGPTDWIPIVPVKNTVNDRYRDGNGSNVRLVKPGVTIRRRQMTTEGDASSTTTSPDFTTSASNIIPTGTEFQRMNRTRQATTVSTTTETTRRVPSDVKVNRYRGLIKYRTTLSNSSAVENETLRYNITGNHSSGPLKLEPVQILPSTRELSKMVPEKEEPISNATESAKPKNIAKVQVLKNTISDKVASDNPMSIFRFVQTDLPDNRLRMTETTTTYATVEVSPEAPTEPAYYFTKIAEEMTEMVPTVIPTEDDPQTTDIPTTKTVPTTTSHIMQNKEEIFMTTIKHQEEITTTEAPPTTLPPVTEAEKVALYTTEELPQETTLKMTTEVDVEMTTVVPTEEETLPPKVPATVRPTNATSSPPPEEPKTELETMRPEEITTQLPEEMIHEHHSNVHHEITEENVPAYLKLTVETASWEELCRLRDDLRDSIIRMLDGMNVTSDSVVFLNLNEKNCREKIEESKSEPSNGPVYLPVNMFLMNENGDFDKNLSEAFLNDWGQYGLDFDLPIRKVDFLTPLGGLYDIPNNTAGVSVIAAIVISCVAGLCVILLGILFVVMKRRQKRFNYGQRCTPVSLDAYSLDSVSIHNSVRRKGLRTSKRSYGNAAFDDPEAPSHSMNFAGLANFSSDKEQLFEEFSMIPQVLPKTDELPPGAETKNRYANVIPLPETRVHLSLKDGDNLSDYINANYVRGLKGAEKLYIACQAPLESTVEEFWRMIWEQQSKVIIMLTDLQENGVEKCADYLPPNEVTDNLRLFGDFQVTMKKRDVKEKYIISYLKLKNMEANLWREVTHLWYLGWPEQGVPSEANSLIAFLIEARSQMKSQSGSTSPGPAVVHCSPGTGRTGTVIACDLCIREYEQTRMVDIPKCVFNLRKDRAGAVQTKDQYAFIYQVLNVYATKLTGGGLESI